LCNSDRADALTGLHHVGQGYHWRGRRRAGGCLAGNDLADVCGPASVAAKMAMGSSATANQLKPSIDLKSEMGWGL